MRFVFAGGGTGGHLYPGLAIARALVRLEHDAQPFFIGAQRGIERDVLPGTEFEHVLLDLHPLYRNRPWRNWRTIAGATRSWRRLRSLMRDLRPRVVVGTGGYAAALALAAARSAHVPIALQEQNSYPGLTMRLFSRSATEIYLGFPEAESRLRKGRATRVLDTGNPIEPPPSPRPDRSTLLREWGFPGDTAHVLLVVGGSQGARPLNATLAASIPSLVERGIHVIWATGTASFPEYGNLASEHVRVVPYLAPIARAYAVANLCVCRAGALTTAELCAWGIPSILVPLPTAAADHQTANARALQRAGCSTILSQEDLNAARLIAEVMGVYGDAGAFAAMSAAALKRARPSAAEDIARQLLKISDIT